MDHINITEHFVSTGKGDIYFKRFRSTTGTSNKPPIILLHESLGSVALWKDFPTQLVEATGQEVIAYDRLGFGQSSSLRSLPSLDFVWQEANEGFAALLEFCQLKKFIVLGHSVGGGMALAAAAIYPAQCKAVISISAQAKVEAMTIKGIQAAKLNFNKPKLFERLAKYHGKKTQWVLDAWTETWLSPRFAQWNLDAVLPGVHCPVQVIHGAQDEYATFAQPQQIVSLVAGDAKLSVLENCGHFPHQEKTAEVLNIVQTFLSRIR